MQSQLLPSRAALIDRIALQLEYGQQIINVVGQSGLGKSYLLESFITDKYPEFNKAFVQVSATLTDNELMHALLEHSFRAPLVDHNLSLYENFQLLHQHAPCGPCLWILDGGRHLSDEIIEQLNRLVKTSNETIYILIGSQQANMIVGALDIHLEPLTWHESKQLMQWYFKNLPMDEDPIFQTFIESSRGNPALLLSWKPEEQSTNLREKKPSNWHWHFLVLTIVLAVLAVGLLYKKELVTLLPDEQVVDVPELVLPPPQLNEQPTNEVVEAPATTSNINSSIELDKSSDSVDTADSAMVLNTTVKNDVQSILSDLEPIVTQPAEVNKDTELPQIAKQTVKSPIDHSGVLEEKTDDQKTELVVVMPDTNATISEEPKLSIHSIDDSSWYVALESSAWTIQVMAVTDDKDAQAFRDEFPNLNAKVYPALRKGTWWYVVTVGQYANIAEAKSARQELPENVLKNQPFYKKVSQIQEEIRASSR
ncbi:SPOR domain-containing protein [Pseudoalteromonas xiamenensis]|uniref:SPOR domain-containing protein n=1 Tax=Pseudoalteromonas xiamenensis TaxID=882626 RepID=UPI0027E430BC|nr:SPOR domain-containing protein [Pseudoalteromonas xiamenensis]WMN58820.1 SPOR domain-containing protein [Pseudoalteromonas xiamenensis]